VLNGSVIYEWWIEKGGGRLFLRHYPCSYLEELMRATKNRIAETSRIQSKSATHSPCEVISNTFNLGIVRIY
jgi:hypothetical protein